jgi:hypothetical protein
LEGELCITVLSLFTTKYADKTGALVRSTNQSGMLPIHLAARNSSLDVIELLLALYPKSHCLKTEVPLPETPYSVSGENLLHLAVTNYHQDIDSAKVNLKVQDLFDNFPDLQKMTNNYGETPFEAFLFSKLDLEIMTIMCEAEETIATWKCQTNGQLPKHQLLARVLLLSSLSMSCKADCFRYLLNLYPAAVGITDDEGFGPVDLAVVKDLDV